MCRKYSACIPNVELGGIKVSLIGTKVSPIGTKVSLIDDDDGERISIMWANYGESSLEAFCVTMCSGQEYMW